ncbi:hypothetical protein P3T40_008842, partial [Paraburkholderia sp. EB58]
GHETEPVASLISHSAVQQQTVGETAASSA